MDPSPLPTLSPSIIVFDTLACEFPSHVPLSFQKCVKNDLKDTGETLKTHYLEAGLALTRANSLGVFTDDELSSLSAAREIINNKIAQQHAASQVYIAANNLRFPA